MRCSLFHPRDNIRKGFLFFIAICLLSGYPSSVFAIDEDFYAGNDVIFYDPDSGTCTPTEATPSDIPITGGDNEEKAWNYLTQKGLTGEQAAGIMGNITIESHFDPLASNAGNYIGIAQWDAAGRWASLVRWANDNGYDEHKFETQLEYLWKEANTRTSGNIEGIKRYSDIPHTTWYWGRYFEVAIIDGSTSDTPLTNVQDLGDRTTAAQAVFDHYSGKSPGPGSPTTQPASAPGCNEGSGSSSGTVGAGKGDFTDSGEVNGWSIVEANAILTDSVWGTRLRYNGWCASIVARVWQGSASTGFGYSPHYAMTLWEDYRSLVHTDHNAKKGAILIYTGGTVYGHVTIYLGNNRILNDGYIEDATEDAENYLGWVDPNDLVWQSPHRLTNVDFLSQYQNPQH